MTDDGPDNLVLRHLREIDRKQDVLLERMDNVTARMSALESMTLSMRLGAGKQDRKGDYVSFTYRNRPTNGWIVACDETNALVQIEGEGGLCSTMPVKNIRPAAGAPDDDSECITSRLGYEREWGNRA